MGVVRKVRETERESKKGQKRKGLASLLVVVLLNVEC
jgi:hypothetical protein